MNYSQKIKEYAAKIGFDACGICRADEVSPEVVEHYEKWLESGFHAGMSYLEKNPDKRFDPSLLVENGKSIVCVALNYYPQTKQKEDVPQFSYYAYGKDYHDVMKTRLSVLFENIKQIMPTISGRAFCDTAPILERYWAAKSGIGFVGKNTLLIIPRKGSFFFLGFLILDAELNEYDSPLSINCGKCTKCLDACPTKTIEAPYLVNSEKCISYQTIENKGDIDPLIKKQLSNHVYGCDICQKVCPWNRFAQPHRIEEFIPKEEFLRLDAERLKNLSIEDYRSIFKGSAVKRAKYEGLMRNIDAITV
ncbi:tRNA epoxyqueuosine(34) reductase QueG [Dysgonomonas sp. 520]|uniref:tRNA epoxyqueuosine(34) reductase QueG n=1 Tax=Dysgonomonas sp. 520 TaxID=2302931 RepID=UPI0013D829C1|nr:tRNA epoxyqueuosine(34) reductase QueG [Dysgonomonas sp. 520]NDW09981.1 tRNA epoxyqueuosine(34) reductase QueG [Dysgonomonas sp. 520]